MGPVHRTPGRSACKVMAQMQEKVDVATTQVEHLTEATIACNNAICTAYRVPIQDRIVKESLYSAKHKECFLIRYEKFSQSNCSHFYHRGHFYHKQACISAANSLPFPGSQRKDTQNEMKIKFSCKMRKEVLCAIPTITHVVSSRAGFQPRVLIHFVCLLLLV